MARPGAEERMGMLAGALRHYDAAQLTYQLAEIAGEEVYLRHGVTLEPGAIVLDVGANVGVAAAYFATACDAGVVHSFEPVSELFELLRDNVASLPACVPHHCGLSRSVGRVAITYYPGAAAMSGLYADPERDRALVRTVLGNVGVTGAEADERLEGAFAPQARACELRTLSAVLREQALERVDLLKIDVERAELDVLAGVDEADWRRIRQVVVEVHDEDERVAAIAGALGERGYTVAAEQDPAMRGTDVHLVYATRR